MMSNEEKMAALDADLRAARRKIDELEFKLADMSWALKLARTSLTNSTWSPKASALRGFSKLIA